MQCEFSETQFVFEILKELTTRCWTPEKAWSAPVMPSQRRELNLGYDFEIKGRVRTLYFQFKVPEKKSTPKCKHWKSFGEPYFDFKIWPDEKTHQHNHLVALAKRDPRNRVYYCAPRFHTLDEFEKYYRRGNCFRRSVYVPCRGLPTISGNTWHHICYVKDPWVKARMYSREEEVDAFGLEQLMVDAEEALSCDSYENIEQCFRGIAESFGLDLGREEYEGALELRFRWLANQLLMRENLHLLLLGE